MNLLHVVVLARLLHVVLNDSLHALLLVRIAHIVEGVLVGYGVEHRVYQNHRVQDELQVVLVAEVVEYLHHIIPGLVFF